VDEAEAEEKSDAPQEKEKFPPCLGLRWLRKPGLRKNEEDEQDEQEASCPVDLLSTKRVLAIITQQDEGRQADERVVGRSTIFAAPKVFISTLFQPPPPPRLSVH
jgi:hypothetical protein